MLELHFPIAFRPAKGDGQFGTTLREKRMGVMIHFDGSVSDAGGISWFADPRCGVSYQDLVTDAGEVVEIAPYDARAYHAGKCRPSDRRLPYGDANSALFGIAALTDDRYQVTALQMLAIAWRTRWYFEQEGWDPRETWRIVGHDTEAWPRGRKCDPTGPNKRNAILAIEDVRSLVPLIQA